MSDQPRSARIAVREVASTLQQAEAIKLVRVVGVVDNMEHRGAADDVLAPLRPRIARLRPPRPLRFARLLFHPLDPVIVPATAWRRGDPSVPRSIIPAITALVHRTLGARALAIETQLAGHNSGESRLMAEAGAQLWPAAAAILATADMPADWTAETGLQRDDFTTLSRQVAAALHCAGRLGSLTGNATEGAARAIGDIVEQHPLALPTIMALLLPSTPDPQAMLHAAEAHVPPPALPQLHAAASQALDFLIDTATEAPPLPADLGTAELELRRIVELVEAAERRTGQPASRTAKITELARRMRAEARTRFDTALATQVLLPLQNLQNLSDSDLTTIEALARDVRRFEATARRIGGADHFDKQLRQHGESLRPTQADAPQQRADKLRIVEILAGPDVAYAMHQCLAKARA